ncbi:MAG: hypothetical protein NC033_02760 [Clostridiales bacterium]|nr:hypothetical protein [Clostridiales bacterium]
MQDVNNTAALTEEEQFKEFKRVKRMEEAKANVLKIECDCLSPYTDRTSLKETCKSANTLQLGAIVVFPNYVKACVNALGNDPQVSLIAAVSYPFGEETTEVKAAAVKRAVKDGVDEVEVCAPTAFLRDGNLAYFKKECKKIKKAAKNCAVRIVLDCAILSEKELLKAAVTAADAGINCLRLNGADGELVASVKSAVKGKCLIKAEKADGVTSFSNLCTMGADTVACTQALDLAQLILKQAESE